MGVSRQSVSKWEAAQNVPDIQKVLQLGQLFGVTIDYLLKDEIEDEEFLEDDGSATTLRRVTLAEANEYIEHRKWSSKLIALGVALCIASVNALFLFAGIAIPGLSPTVAGLIGFVLFMVLIVTAVVIFIYCGFKNKPYEYLDKVPFETEYGVRGMLKEHQKQMQSSYMISIIMGVTLCIVSIIPVMFGGILNSQTAWTALLCIMFFFLAIGVYLFVLVGIKWASIQRLLKEGEFENRKKSKIKEAITTTYWILAIAIFLVVSFANDSWDKFWIIMAVAGVLFGAVSAIMNVFDGKK